ncbi:MAG: SAM-dependent methyltransferase [Proteobacteria bacterium]|nr:SAM-dependent methyltransferase [Pseudomonadota bacterium]
MTAGAVPLGAEEAAHEARVLAHVHAELAAAGGWLPFSRYMELALYAPGLGYYAAGAHKLGRGGDFVTAPELSPVFARCLAREVGGVLAALGGGAVLELGAGTGALAVELLAALGRAGLLPERYAILEPSPDLRERQVAAVARLPAALARRVDWLDAPPPAASLAGVVLANEVADALPVERFRIGGAGTESLGVGLVAGRLASVPRPADGALAAAVAALGVPLALGQVGELCPALEPWVATVTAPLAAGVALFLDYGAARRELYGPAHGAGTLACFHRQRRSDDPFARVGLQDITAWVDFTRLAEAGLAAGLEVAGYTTQALYLLANGFEAELAALRATLAPADEPLAARAAARLVMPNDMGERFKCLALARHLPRPLAGFGLRDFTATL